MLLFLYVEFHKFDLSELCRWGHIRLLIIISCYILTRNFIFSSISVFGR
uniref:Uncharacterized protein n=1 Tax=Arundo donax TaxID=35708 RepID=A0A0A9GIC0_ARUDO